ncbi:hypothetical protein [Luteolibacter luteus]|uniref:Uncharacterized protein n=1 Tax=Luteolibacter luteus TaxID=2728835 RepID=A0A858RN27_9BACT|nr:hypothetical protein [Luteolibacter luteus]QJE97991.1 hypothetical protein HHL09_20095 [Luteolibacter luteus]
MKAISAFAAFERGLRVDHEEEQARQMETLGIELDKPRPMGRPIGSTKRRHEERAEQAERKARRKPKLPTATMNVAGELAVQLDSVGQALGIRRKQLAQIILAAGLEALLAECEENRGRVVFPFCLTVHKNPPKGFYHLRARVIPSEMMEELRMPGSAKSRWSRTEWEKAVLPTE